MRQLPSYLFGTMDRVIQEKRRRGIGVVDLGMGNPIDPPHPDAVERLCQVAHAPGSHRYSAGNGVLPLREAVARRYARLHGVDLDPETEVLAGLGSKELFSHLCLALVGPGDAVIVPAPSLPAHVYGVVLAGGNAIGVDCAQPDHFLSAVAGLAKRRPKPKILILSYPHNPTAATVEAAFFGDVVRLAQRHRFIVVHDFAYGDVCFDGYRAPSFLSVPGAKAVGVETTTMSKGFNMAGWRLGFCCGNAEIVRALATVKGYYDDGIFEAIQLAGVSALAQGEAPVEAQAREYQVRRDILVMGLRRLGWKVERPQASMFVWARYPQPPGRRLDAVTFARQLLAEAHVAVSPASGFGALGEGHVCIALVEKPDRLREALARSARTHQANPTRRVRGMKQVRSPEGNKDRHP